MKLIKNISIAVMVLALIIVSVIAWKQYQELNNRNQLNIQNKKEIKAEADIIARKVDKQGLEHVTIEAAKNVVPYHQITKEAAVSPGILDTTAMALGVLKKQIQELTSINSELRIKNEKLTKVVNDGHISYNFKDRFANLRVILPTDTNQSASFDLAYNADLTITRYWKRKWLLGAKKSYIDIYSNDPRTTINGVKRLEIEQSPAAWGLRIQGNATYDVKSGALGLGPAVQLDINRISLQGIYQYNFIHKEWTPVIQARYDLVRF